MKPEEAIRILEVAKAECEWNAPLEYQAAFDMAISALQAQDLPDTNAGDMISRQAAIDAIRKGYPDVINSDYKDGLRIGTDRAIYHLENLPTAQPDHIANGSKKVEPCEDVAKGCTYRPDCPWFDGTKCNSPNDPTHNECDYDRGIFPESYNYDPRADIYYLAEKIGIHRLYELVVELRGEPEPCDDAVSRKDVLALAESGRLISNGNYKSVCKAIMELPSVTPKRKTGKWTKDNTCEFCGFEPWYEGNIHTLSYCPNCGSYNGGES